MNTSQALHDDITPDSIGPLKDKPLLELTSQELEILDPLERLAAQLMIERGKAVLVEEESV